MEIEFEIKKGNVLVFLVVFTFLAGILFVYAYNPYQGNPDIFGHTLDEIDGVEEFTNLNSVSSGFCVISATENSCPEGFSPSNSFKTNRIIRAIDTESHLTIDDSSTVGSQGGSTTHTHNRAGKWSCVKNNLVAVVEDLQSASNLPPYVKVSICCANL